MSPHRRFLPTVCSLTVAAVAWALAGPAASAQTTATTPTTAAGVPALPSPTTSTSTSTSTTTAPKTAPKAPAKATTTTRPKAPTTTAPGVPSVPVGGPPTTIKPGAAPAPQPDPTPVLEQVQSDLNQLTAIEDYRPAEDSVGRAQANVTAAGAALLSARRDLQAAQVDQAAANQARATADAKLRQLALAAYTGVGYSAPSGNPGGGNTPGGLSGMDALDAQQMLVVLGQKGRQNDQAAHREAVAAAHRAAASAAAYQRTQASVAAAEATLLAAQQTLKIITTAAVTPGAASATALPSLTAIENPGVPATATTTTSSNPTTTVAGNLSAAQAATNPVTWVGPPPTSPLILSKPILDAKMLAAWYASTGRKPNTTVPIDQLAAAYQHWGEETGVRYDLAFAQSVIETGFFSFPAGGQLTAKDNNFAGIGACDTCAHGWTFPDASTGAEAQMELLYEYATTKPLPARPDLKNVIGGTGIGGCCDTWTELAGHWASSTVYGISIMTVYHQMLTWVIPQEMQSAGLVSATDAAAEGPELAPLPGAPPTAAKPAHGPANATAAKPGSTPSTAAKKPAVPGH